MSIGSWNTLKIGYLKTPPNATSSPNMTAVGSVANAMSMALVMDCSSVIFSVSPEWVIYFVRIIYY